GEPGKRAQECEQQCPHDRGLERRGEQIGAVTAIARLVGIAREERASQKHHHRGIMEEAGEREPRFDHGFSSNVKLPVSRWVSSPTACQATVYLPGLRSPSTGTISCALSEGLKLGVPTFCASPAWFFTSMPESGNSIASVN